jgi:Peptidase of plants and bacteria
MADYVRLKAGLAPPHWKKEKGRMGQKWDEGYERTAWFLEWLEDCRGAGTISRINETMGLCKYEEDKFWPELFGEKIDVLWNRYKESWDEDEIVTQSDLKSEDKESDSSASTEPEIVDLDEAEKEEAQIALRPKKWKG